MGVSADQRRLRNLALLLTATGAPSAQGRDAVTEQELEALVAGDLDAKEHAELLERIAADERAYQAWASLLEATQEMERGNGVLRRSGIQWWIGPALAATVLLAVWFPATDPARQVQGLYEGWQSELTPDTRPAISGSWRGTAPAERDEAPLAWFEYGLGRGLERLGEGFQIVGLAASSLPREAPGEISRAAGQWTAAGELSALLYFNCRGQGLDPALYQEARRLLQRWDALPSAWGYERALASAGGAAALCESNDRLLRHVAFGTEQ